MQGNLLLGSRILGFGIRNTTQGYGIPLTIEIQNPSSTDKVLNTMPGIRNLLRKIQNPKHSLTSDETIKNPKHAEIPYLHSVITLT